MRIAALQVVYRRAMVPVLALGLLLGAAGRARADPLNPLDFTSLGAFPTATGIYTIDTSGTPTLTGPGGTNLTGVVSNGVAVFDFDSINVLAPAPLPGQFFTATGSLPLALLSRTNVTIAGSIDGSAQVSIVVSGGPGGGNGAIMPSTPGGGPGGGGRGIESLVPFVSTGGGGGGFGAPGGAGASSVPNVPGGLGGASYGDLARRLQGGSGGGSSFGFSGGGGGAIEIGAVGSLTISGHVIANGGNPFSFPSTGGGGGGSGGGIFLHADSVLLTGSLSAVGGDGGPAGIVPGLGGRIFDAGGGGGGGLVTILFGPGGYDAASGATINVSGGAGGLGGMFSADGSPGGAGVFTTEFVPEPASLVVMGTGVLGLLGYAWLRRKRARA